MVKEPVAGHSNNGPRLRTALLLCDLTLNAALACGRSTDSPREPVEARTLGLTRANPAAAGSLAPAVAPSTACLPVQAQHDLSPEQQSEFFHAPEGSENLPLFLLKRLQQDSRPFIENPGRFGLLEDDKEYKGRRLPVGMSVDRPQDVAWAKIDFVGFNCAACHVGELTAAGCKQRILGAPARFDIKKFYADFALAIQPMLGVDGALTMLRWFYEERGAGGASEELNQKIAISELARQQGDLGGTFQTPFKEVLAKANDPGFIDPQLRRATDQRPKLPTGVMPAGHLIGAPGSDHGLPQGLKSLNQPVLRERFRSTLTDYWDLLQLVRARLVFIKTLTQNNGQPITAAGPGRVDAFMTALNMLFGKAANAPMTSPVSFPHLWGVKDLQNFHWDDNTNGIMDRNIGQAMGLGGVFMKRADGSYHSTLKPRGIASLEEIAEHFKAPQWPFSNLDGTKAASGKKHYEIKCARCHEPEADYVPATLDELKTDRLRVTNFDINIDGKLAIYHLRDTLADLKQGSYNDHQVSLEEQKRMERNREVRFFKTTTYSARPLNGVWATAPYLHNNSVPSLALLLGVDGKARPARFTLQAGYDVANVGLEYQESASGTFDTSLPGNANTGHDYGATLTSAEKRELLEYLKSLK